MRVRVAAQTIIGLVEGDVGSTLEDVRGRETSGTTPDDGDLPSLHHGHPPGWPAQYPRRPAIVPRRLVIPC
jgi:hypothetical protein